MAKASNVSSIDLLPIKCDAFIVIDCTCAYLDFHTKYFDFTKVREAKVRDVPQRALSEAGKAKT